MDELKIPTPEPSVVLIEEEGTYSTRTAFHMKTGDYFAMLATLLSFVEETASALKEKDEAMEIASAEIKRLKQDLLYLQENYCVELKPRSE